MTGERGHYLPGTPPHVLERVWNALSDAQRAALEPHLLNDTSAEWLSATLARYGHHVSASSLRGYRRSLHQNGECNVDRLAH